MKLASYWAAVAAVCTILIYPSVIAALLGGLSVFVAAGIPKAARVMGGRAVDRRRMTA